jgi:hypothetical protein
MTLIRVLNKFVAAEITATVRHIPIEVPLGSIEGMPKPCVVNCDNLRTISKVRLVKKISKLSQKRVHEVKRAVGYALAWEELIVAGDIPHSSRSERIGGWSGRPRNFQCLPLSSVLILAL